MTVHHLKIHHLKCTFSFGKMNGAFRGIDCLPFYNSVNAVDLPTEHTEMNTVLAEPHCTLLSRWHFSNVWLLLLQLFPNIQEVLYPNLCWSMVNNWISWAGGWETLIYSIYLLWWYLHPGHFHATNVATE